MTRYGFAGRAIAFACGLVSVLSGTAGAQGHGVPTGPRREYSTEPLGDRRASAWREDLGMLVREMERIHPDLYHRTGRAEFAAAVAALSGRLGSLAEHEAIVEIARLVAMIGDGHTSLPLYFAAGVDFHILPVRFGVYGGQLWVEAADRAYGDLVGGRVTAFGGVPADTAIARVVPLISRDNDQWILAVAPHLLNRAEVLHALRLSDRIDAVDLTVEQAGRSRTMTVRVARDAVPGGFGLPFLPQYTQDWIDARNPQTPPPLYQQRFDELYRFEYLPDRRMLWIGFDQVQNRSGGESALEFFQRAMTWARDNESRIDRVVLDIRNNTGGEGGLLDAIVREIVRTREVDRPGRFFVVTGRRTFSAAQVFATQLDRYTSAIFVGEPTSGRPNFWGSHEMVALPAARITVAVSPSYHQSGQVFDDRPWIVPRLAVDPTFDDYVNNRDRALDVIEAWQGDDEWLATLRRDIDAADTAVAAARVIEWDADPIHRWTGSTALLNRLGYEYLRSERVPPAVRVFALNVRLHPDYANGWDSLGEALVALGDRAGAAKAYAEALRLNPDNANAREWLRRLAGE